MMIQCFTAVAKLITLTGGGRVSGGLGPLGTTGQPALIYVPPGTYLIGGTVQLFINTQIIGDALNFPTIKAASTVANGSVVISGFDPGQGSTTNFYIGIRNLNIDTTAASADDSEFASIDVQV
jgi:glucan 1,3-beta-glucosidase